MQPWQNDFTHFIFDGINITQEVSKDEVRKQYFFKKSRPEAGKTFLSLDDYMTFADAVSLFQKAGAQGKSVHMTNDLEVLRAAKVIGILIERYGQVFSCYRGFSGNLPLESHTILYGSRDKKVAEFYGKVQSIRCVGVLSSSTLKSVTGDEDSSDEEIIFLPSTILG